MGMYGALVLYNPTDPAASNTCGTGGNQPCGPNSGKGGNLFGWSYDNDTILLLSEIDTRQHISEMKASIDPKVLFNPIDYSPQYWAINGLNFPNTIHAWSSYYYQWSWWIASHPGYDPFIQGSVSRTNGVGGAAHPGEKVLIRLINMGFETQPMHMHGYHGKILGSDQRAWLWANTAAGAAAPYNIFSGIWGANGTPWGQGQEKQTVTIGSGEAYEWLVDMGQQALSYGVYAGSNPPLPLDPNAPISTFPGGSQTRYNAGGPTTNQDTTAAAIPDPFNPGDNYIPGPQVTGLVIGDPTAPPAGQYFPFHNHDDYKATNNGVYPGGMFTMLKTMP